MIRAGLRGSAGSDETWASQAPGDGVWLGESNWFAIQTRAHRESLAAARVAELDVEVFLPRVLQELNVCGTLRKIRKALFPGYFFAWFCPLENIDMVRYASGVLRVVGACSRPTPIPAEVMEGLQGLVQADGYVRLDPAPLREGERVVIVRGPLAGWTGRVECEMDDRRRVAILLETIDSARVLADKRQVERAGAV